VTPPVCTDIGSLIRDARFSHLDERGLQDEIADLFATAGLTVERESRLTPTERIDFLYGRTGIEVKVIGSTASVRRQLGRYAQSGAVDRLILVSTHATHRALDRITIGAVPVQVVRPPWM
jgi:hypothetical protein